MITNPLTGTGLGRRELLSGSVAALVALMLGQPAGAATPERAGADPRHAFADRLSDLTIPATDTPGASEARVALFVLMALDQRMGSLEPVQLERVHLALDAAAGGTFMAASREQQGALLALFDQAAFGAATAAAESPETAWKHVKAAIVAGYYTSEIGATKELVYDPVPGSFQNIHLTPEFRSRSNDGFGGSL